ncbi:MAG TPA: TetR/AcrR family transcriptional regulator [Pilimelia sp.]|nr:TetR/AcrR family transcriptional regulator [Pilimelia sp.]
MPTRQEQKAATRQRLLRYAEHLVVRQGFTGTRTLDIARAAGVAHGSVFLHFPSREALMLTVASEMGRKLTDRLHALAATGSGLRDALTAHVRCIEEHEALYHRLLVDGPSLPPEFRTAWLGMQSAVATHVLAAAEVDIRAGTIRPMPPHLLFNTWLGLIHHYLVNREVFAPGGSVMATHGQVLIEHYLTLVTPVRSTR